MKWGCEKIGRSHQDKHYSKIEFHSYLFKCVCMYNHMQPNMKEIQGQLKFLHHWFGSLIHSFLCSSLKYTSIYNETVLRQAFGYNNEQGRTRVRQICQCLQIKVNGNPSQSFKQKRDSCTFLKSLLWLVMGQAENRFSDRRLLTLTYVREMTTLDQWWQQRR